LVALTKGAILALATALELSVNLRPYLAEWFVYGQGLLVLSAVPIVHLFRLVKHDLRSSGMDRNNLVGLQTVRTNLALVTFSVPSVSSCEQKEIATPYGTADHTHNPERDQTVYELSEWHHF
jgi:hypothetical protein